MSIIKHISFKKNQPIIRKKRNINNLKHKQVLASPRLCLGTMNFGEGKKGLHRYWSNDLKQSRKIIKKAVELQMLTELYNLTPFVSMQNHYNLIYREEEREMIPYCNQKGIALTPWSPLARGLLAGTYKGSIQNRFNSPF